MFLPVNQKKGTPMDQATELKQIAPASSFVEKVIVQEYQRDKDREVSNERVYYLRQFTYLNFFEVLPHAQTIYTAIQSLNLDLTTLLDKFENDPLSVVGPLLSISAAVGKSVAVLTALAINKPVEYLGTIDPDDGVRLTIAMFKVNVDFFVQRILPMLETMKPAAEATKPATASTDGPIS
jgi:hypothetical protein